MACRGRGTLTIRPSANPFFQPTSRDRDAPEFVVPPAKRPPREPRPEDGYDFSFLYARANDEIGRSIPPSGTKLGTKMAKRLSLADVARQKAGLENAVSSSGGAPSVTKKRDPTELAEAIVKIYNHKPKPEHIMYQTSGNEYGSLAPTVATLTAERKARSQQFSNSFNGIKFRDQGLNTSITKSNVHDALDVY